MYIKKLARERTGTACVQAMVNARTAAPEVSVIFPAVPATNIMPSPPSSMLPPVQTALAIPVKRRPGHPPGSGKKQTTAMIAVEGIPAAVTVEKPAPPTVEKRKPGRPPGSGKKVTTDPIDVKSVVKRKRVAAPKMMELSITISVAGSDIAPTVFPLIQDFLQRSCEAGMFAVERGGSLLNLHLQGVVSMLCTSPVDAKKQITAAIDWTDHRPVGAGVCVKKLTNKGIHTFVGMIGYCLKDRQELHFMVCMKNVSDAAQREGMMLFTFYGAADLKNRVEVNPTNIMHRALQYNKFQSHNPLGTSFRGCLRRMIVGGHYTPSTSWVINKGMDRNRMSALWKCYVQPGTVTLADIDSIFFWMPRVQPCRYIEGTHHEVHLLKTAVLEDMKDSDHSSPRIERVSGNLPAQELPDWASYIPLVAGMNELQIDSSDRPLEGVASNCICCN